MKRGCMKIICVLIALMLFCLCTVHVFASENVDNIHCYDTSTSSVVPLFVNCSKCSTTFTVSDPNTAHVGVTYNAYPDNFLEAKVTVQIQKKFLGLFWKTVNIGYPNNEWIDYSTSVNGYFYNSFTIDGKGTYRANFTVEIRGLDGTVDIM